MADGVAPVSIVGLHGGQWFGRAAERAVTGADVLIGAPRQLELLPSAVPGERIELWGDLGAVLGTAERRRREGRAVCVLAAGDPGFFGLVRLASRRWPGALEVHPAPSSVSLAFARVGVNWDDAVVVSAHGRPLGEAVELARRSPKVAVLVSRDQPPEALGRQLLDAGCGPRQVTVCSRLGEPDEVVTPTDLPGLAAGSWDPLSVVVLMAPEPAPDAMGLAWGLAEDAYVHQAGMITKAEIRAVALGKLHLPAAGVLWDVGAGSGSVAAECARLAPGLAVWAVERSEERAVHLRTNLAGTGAGVVVGEAPAALEGLPDPDRVFVGGGGTAVLTAAWGRLRPGGWAVATLAVLDTAASAAGLLGQLVQLSVARAVPVGDDGRLRLAAENPVFVAWGQKP